MVLADAYVITFKLVVEVAPDPSGVLVVAVRFAGYRVAHVREDRVGAASTIPSRRWAMPGDDAATEMAERQPSTSS